MDCDYQFQMAVIGGDIRQIAVAEALAGMAQSVKICGHPQEKLLDNLVFCATPQEALADANVVILPISGVNDAGRVRGYQADQFIDFGRYLNSLARGTLLVVGSLTVKWLEQATHQGLKVIQYAEDDTIAVLNSIPTAEGAVQIAMEELPITIHGSQVMVIGFGRVGVTVARVFQGLGAHVTVSARRSELLARAREMGCRTLVHSQLASAISQMQIIINTVPAMVIDREMLNQTLPGVLILDLASAPGGIDFSAAKEMGIKAIFAPGLPGKVAPQTAGEILATAIPELIIKAVSSGNQA